MHQLAGSLWSHSKLKTVQTLCPVTPFGRLVSFEAGRILRSGGAAYPLALNQSQCDCTGTHLDRVYHWSGYWDAPVCSYRTGRSRPGAARHARPLTLAWCGYRSRNLVTRVGKLGLRVPHDRRGRLILDATGQGIRFTTTSSAATPISNRSSFSSISKAELV